MSEHEEKELALLGDAVSSLPDQVKTPFLKAISNLLGGLTAIPAAWVKGPAQAIEDRTAGRSLVSARLAKAVAERAINDPVLMQAAAEVYLPDIVRKAKPSEDRAERSRAPCRIRRPR